MMPKNKIDNIKGFIIKLNSQSKITEEIYNSFSNELYLKNKNLTQFIDSESMTKYFQLLGEAEEQKVVFGREIIMNINNHVQAFVFIILEFVGDEKLLFAANQSRGILKYYEELMRINNDYVNSLRKTIKEEIQKREKGIDSEIYNEISRQNNELINLQRELNKINSRLDAEKEKYRLTLSTIMDGVISLDSKNNIVYINSAGEEMLGWNQQELFQKNIKNYFEIMDCSNNEINENIANNNRINIRSTKELFAELSAKGQLDNHEALLKNRYADNFPVEISAAEMEDKLNNQGKVIVFRDISRRKKNERQLKKYASRDELTEVINRRVGMEYLQKEIEKAEELNNKLSLIFIDVNDLKLVNDNFGHKEGDLLLRNISDTLQNFLRKDDIVVRFGGDEFLLILPQSSYVDAEKVWERIKDRLKKADKENDKNYKISVSHGTAEYSGDYNLTVDQLINKADKRMYREKEKIKSGKKKY